MGALPSWSRPPPNRLPEVTVARRLLSPPRQHVVAFVGALVPMIRTSFRSAQYVRTGALKMPSCGEGCVDFRFPVSGVRGQSPEHSRRKVPKLSLNTGMNEPIEFGGSCQKSLLPGISDPKESQHLPPPPGGQDEVRGESPGIPFCSSGFPDLSQLVSELELIRLLGRGGSPTPRAQRAVCRRWIDHHAIPTMRLGRSRFYARQQVLEALVAAPPLPGSPRPRDLRNDVRASLGAFRMSLENSPPPATGSGGATLAN